ncbi:MAG: PaaI family thioesterase [Cyclobacteriaceae bacterium]|jgi:acyl-coenzyme A thioesterase PaaI-like protein|nr:PaaI family thioesterase [Flammeovirgaceae bacterium]MDG1106103.1 PaaI family thioesterase [Cyclobacteriaceae bacterium]
MTETKYFQDHMPGNVCFGCGAEHQEGLQIKSFWEGSTAICHWQPEEKYRGWPRLLNGGVMATLIDCHCMGTAMAYAYQQEDRDFDSTPFYRYATGGLKIKYLKPTPTKDMITLRAQVIEHHRRKITMSCTLESSGRITVEAEVIAIQVYDSSKNNETNQFE